MFFKKKEKTPMVFVIKSDEIDQLQLDVFKKELQAAYPDKQIAVLGIAREEEVYAITG